MTSEQVTLISGGIAALAVGLVFIGLVALNLNRRPHGLARPEWDRMCAEIDYFRKALHHIFKAQGYKVTGYSILQEKYERETFMVLFALRKGGVVYCALCGRWFVPVTSDIIERFEKALASTRAPRGMIVTTGIFSPAALDRAHGLPVTLMDRTTIKQWIEEVWPP